jgi:hypothetical protein
LINAGLAGFGDEPKLRASCWWVTRHPAIDVHRAMIIQVAHLLVAYFTMQISGMQAFFLEPLVAVIALKMTAAQMKHYIAHFQLAKATSLRAMGKRIVSPLFASKTPFVSGPHVSQERVSNLGAYDHETNLADPNLHGNWAKMRNIYFIPLSIHNTGKS